MTLPAALRQARNGVVVCPGGIPERQAECSSASRPLKEQPICHRSGRYEAGILAVVRSRGGQEVERMTFGSQ